jgi:hypothetical protein
MNLHPGEIILITSDESDQYQFYGLYRVLAEFDISAVAKRFTERDELRKSVTAQATCEWTPDNDPDWNTWTSACGETWVFEVEGPAENDMQFCPFCGRLLVDRIAGRKGGEG